MLYKTLKVVAVFLLTILTIGCAASVATVGVYEGLTSSDKNKATIYVYREELFIGSMNQYDVLINGYLAGSLPNGSFFMMNADAGNISIEDAGMGKGSKITVENGNIYCMKMTLNFNVLGKSADINPVNQKQCRAEMKGLEQVRLK